MESCQRLIIAFTEKEANAFSSRPVGFFLYVSVTVCRAPQEAIECGCRTPAQCSIEILLKLKSALQT
jgi:hypothetical protein